jgi:hypothetical protein
MRIFDSPVHARFLTADAPATDYENMRYPAALLLADQKAHDGTVVPAGTWGEDHGDLGPPSRVVHAGGKSLIVASEEVLVVRHPEPLSPGQLLERGYVEETVHALDEHDLRVSRCGRRGRWVAGHVLTEVFGLRYPIDCPGCLAVLEVRGPSPSATPGQPEQPGG